jgi:hypothetical protein
MEKPEHHNIIVFYPEVNGVRESPQQAATDFMVSFWRNQWISQNLMGTGIERTQEFITKSRGLLFVPCITGKSIVLHFGEEA